MIGIYKIENLVNHKVYIGQSIDIEKRYKEHLRSGQPDKYSLKSERDKKCPIHLAMQKYGVENFELTILQECKKEEMDDLEIYYIKKYRSLDKKFGYNISPGGQNHVGDVGEKHSQAKLTQKEVWDIKKKLKNGMTTKEISKDYPFISKSTISMINNGHIWKEDGELYPIFIQKSGTFGQNNGNSKVNEQEVMEIRQDYVNKSFSDVLKDYPQHSKSLIRSIVYGESWKHLPIYKKSSKQWIEPCIDYSQSLK